MSPESGSGSSSEWKNVFYYIVFSVVQQTLSSKANYREQIHVIKGAVGLRAPHSRLSSGKVMCIVDQTQYLLAEGPRC